MKENCIYAHEYRSELKPICQHPDSKRAEQCHVVPKNCQYLKNSSAGKSSGWWKKDKDK